MDILKIERTSQTPELIFDADDFLLSIKGNCRPEDARRFFQPALEWLTDFLASGPKVSATPISVEVKLEYYDSASYLKLVEVFQLIAMLHSIGMKVLIEWKYSEDDELIQEAGQELSDICGLPFNFIVD
jgi:hypothetical protein